MSWRIEHADPLELLRELPDGWAQTCITSPPAGDPGYTLAVLGEVRRILREDATLWLPATCPLVIPRALTDQGWVALSARQARERGLLVFSKQPGRVLLDLSRGPLAPPRRLAPRARLLERRRYRRAWCVPVSRTGGVLTEQMVRWCITAGSVPVACGVCGAPYQRTPHTQTGWRWAPRCAHLDDRGRCLVLDPFASATTALAAIGHGRSFLGITRRPALARTVQQRLAACQKTRCPR